MKERNNNKPSNQYNGKEVKNYSKEIIICLGIIIVILIATICYLVYKGNHPKLLEGKEVVATMDGKEFTAEDLYEKLNSQGGYSVLTSMINEFIIDKEVEDKSEADKYADSIISQYKSQYKEAGMSFDDALTSSGYANVNEFKNAVVINYLYNEIGEKYIKDSITEKELKTYYDNHVSDELGVKHILIAPDVDSDASSDEKKKAETAALEKAKNIIKQLNEGADFETLAKENSDDEGSAANGGVINNVIKDKYIAEFWNAAYKLKLNTYTKEPVKSQYGYHIIYKVSHTEKQPFDEIKDSLYSSVIDAKLADDSNLIEKAWIEIHKKYNLNIIDTTIKNNYDLTVKNLNK